MKYNIEIKKSAFRALKKLPQFDQIQIAKVIKRLSVEPRPQNAIKLAGSSFYRVRCGDYRIIYDVLNDRLIIIILKLAHRKDIYKRK